MRRRLAVALAVLVVAEVAVLVALWPRGGDPARPAPPPVPPADEVAWRGLDPPGRCASAMALVTYPNQWPMVCRWRVPGETAGGSAFPPPVAEAPWDNPRIELYLDRAEARAVVAHTIAHELGHMHLTREPIVGEAWLLARGLSPDTPWQVWVEDYAEAFAVVFGPPAEKWFVSTDVPTAAALAALKEQFFPG